ncbi:unnamed protein product [Parascedosporium putredinis]|uniref:Glutaredoxin domain-containing protein n=1 Tax=Parascedosporium putredinis TaxID=1442378 RepID=A0A9P1H3F7_9PEZI|nr:unnamed protein product [Parascedosporium putredinis]CAI7995822.1 unnamed protein product [Parascedosporium putredinis]
MKTFASRNRNPPRSISFHSIQDASQDPYHVALALCHPRLPLLHHPRPRNRPLLARLLSDQTRQAIDKAVSTAPVILGMQGVDPAKFAAFNVLEDDELRQGIKEYSDWPTIPQFYLEGEFIGGCDILVSMHQSGDLATLLAEKKVLFDQAESEKKDA